MVISPLLISFFFRSVWNGEVSGDHTKLFSFSFCSPIVTREGNSASSKESLKTALSEIEI
jgi:hypothetical protein